MPLNFIKLKHLLVSAFFTCLSCNVLADIATLSATPVLKPYQATYHIYKDGKVMAEQKTKLSQLAPNHFLLNDITKGTHGLASFTGFERSEGSEFLILKSNWEVQQHQMKQKVTFSKRFYSFKRNKSLNQIEGKHKKKQFIISGEEHPISAQMLPLRLADLACKNLQTSFKIAVLKSKKISHYQFNAIKQNDKLIKVSREYPAKSNKKSHVWFDPNQNCLAVKTEYNDEDNLIETKIHTFNGKAVAH